MSALSSALRQRIRQQASARCGYCLTQEIVSGIPLTIEHLLPKAKGGEDCEDNLWLSCRLCNEAKGVLTEARDPKTNLIVPLFHPRTQQWADHFAWNLAGTHIIGLTPVGRATIEALSLNSELRTLARALWVEAGWHPPTNL